MSEADRIQRLVQRFGDDPRLIVPSGDDAAVARAPGEVTVTSVDAVVEGFHFTLPQWPLQAVAHKATAAALSDLAAMGCAAGEIYVAVGLPRSIGEPEFDAITEGIIRAANAADAVVAGGDLTASHELWLSITVVGHAASADLLVTRSGAQPADAVVVTGRLGGARLALELIRSGAQADDAQLLRQFAPTPQLAAGQALAAAGATAMIDISDGLAGDAAQLARASAVGIEIELSRLPLADGVTDPSEAAISGEEYELLATLPQSALETAERALRELGVELSVVGSVVEGSGSRLVDALGAEHELRGFDHFDRVDQ